MTDVLIKRNWLHLLVFIPGFLWGLMIQVVQAPTVVRFIYRFVFDDSVTMTTFYTFPFYQRLGVELVLILYFIGTCRLILLGGYWLIRPRLMGWYCALGVVTFLLASFTLYLKGGNFLHFQIDWLFILICLHFGLACYLWLRHI